MRRKYHIITACAILILIGMTVLAPMANAAEPTLASRLTSLALGGIPGATFNEVSTGASSFLTDITLGVIQFIVAGIVNIALFVMHYFVVIAAAILGISINLTLHIKDFVDQTQGVYLVWQTIRDISGLFIIFALLYCSFLLILDQTSKSFGSVGNLIKNIVIGGILINFSFFITSVLIDASNIVSLALYKGIVSGTPDASLNVNTLSSNYLNGTDVNIGNVFMQYLSPQMLYNPANLQLGSKTTSASVPDPLKTVFQGVVGVVIMFTVGISFLLAALAFAARLIILIFLLAFSPIWFASMIFPILKEKSKHFTDQLYAQLIFMPIYLLLLYAAMAVIKGSTFFINAAGQPSVGTGPSGWLLGYIVLAVNDFFVIFMINLPLVVAFSYGGSATEWLKSGVDKFGAKNVWKNVGGWAGRNTVGRAAYAIDERLAKTRPGNWSFGREIRAGTTGLLAKSKMGSGLSYEGVRIEHADVVRRANANTRLRDLERLSMEMRSETDPAKYNIISAKYGKIVSEMGGKEKLELSPETWQNKEFLKYIDNSDYKAYRNSERVEDTEDVKEKVKQARRAAFRDALAREQDDAIEHMSEELDGHELMKQVGKFYQKGTAVLPVITDPRVVRHLTPTHLKTFEDENIDDATRKNIGNQIDTWAIPGPGGRGNHPAFGFIHKPDNVRSWIP